MFFPRKHALYQEDPEYYRGVTVSSRNIRRVPLTGYGIGRARTYRSTISVERRARYLLRMRLSRREPRLETVLQTTRRIPETELEQFVPVIAPDSEEVVLEKGRVLAQRIAEADAAIFARSKKFVFVKKTRAPKLTSAEAAAAELDRQFEEHITTRNSLFKDRIAFFQRAYSTDTSRALISTAKLIAQQGRLAAAEGEQSTAFSELSARARVKARLVARGRTNFVASTDFMVNAGGLDPRFLRYKSPRNRQYEIRKSPLAVTKNLINKDFTALTYFRQKRESL